MYADEAVARLAFVRNANGLGFTLAEIRELLSLRHDPEGDCGDVRRRAQARLQDVEARIRSLERIRDSLRRLADACRGRGPIAECPILEALEPEDGPCRASS